MINLKFLFPCLFIIIGFTMPAKAQKDKISLVIHGGAGTILKKDMTPEKEKQYEEKLSEALKAGYDILNQGGTSTDAITAVITILEDSPLFNAGKGAVLTAEGKAELDAAIMEGKSGKAGSVAGVTTVKNPILLARAVMEKSPHVMMIGKGAEVFAKEQQLTLVENSYFYTEHRTQQLKKIQAEEQQKGGSDKDKSPFVDEKFGTVGAVALDMYGNLAAGTSTGGMTNKKFGRVGDTPIIGAGTYCNQEAGVSATGHGEYFIRLNVAYDIVALMMYAKMSAEMAAKTVIHEKLTAAGGTGGVIVLDKNGNITMPFNTEGMYRGYIKADGKPIVMIYK